MLHNAHSFLQDKKNNQLPERIFHNILNMHLRVFVDFHIKVGCQ